MRTCQGVAGELPSKSAVRVHCPPTDNLSLVADHGAQRALTRAAVGVIETAPDTSANEPSTASCTLEARRTCAGALRRERRRRFRERTRLRTKPADPFAPLCTVRRLTLAAPAHARVYGNMRQLVPQRLTRLPLLQPCRQANDGRGVGSATQHAAHPRRPVEHRYGEPMLAAQVSKQLLDVAGERRRHSGFGASSARRSSGATPVSLRCSSCGRAGQRSARTQAPHSGRCALQMRRPCVMR